MTNELKNVLRPVLFSVVLAVLVGTAASASSVGLMSLSAWLIASAALQPPLYTLSLAILGVRFCGIMRAVFRYADRYMTHQAGFALFGRFRTGALRHVIASLPFRRRRANGDAFDIIVSAVDSLRDSVLRCALPPVTVTLIAWLAAVWLGFYSLPLASVIAAAWFVFVLFVPYIAWRLYRRQIEPPLELAQDVLELYEGSEQLRVFGWNQARLHDAESSIKAYQHWREECFCLKSRIKLSCELLMGVFFILIILILVQAVSLGNFSAAAAICMMLTAQAVLELLMALPELTEQLAEAAASWRKLQPFYQHRDKRDNAAERCLDKEAVFSAVDLSCGYGGEPICRNMTFSLHKGQKTLLLGSSGCGKSTLLYAMTGMLMPSAGELFISGRSYGKMEDSEVRSHFAASFQEHHIFHMSLRDNFQMLHPGISDDEITASLKRAGLNEPFLLDDLDYMLASGGTNLSGGQRRRLQLALCTAEKRDIVLLDEPTAGLDIYSARRFMEQLIVSSGDAALLVTSHDLSIVDYFDEVIMMDKGRIAEQGRIKNLIKDKNSLLFTHLNYNNLL